jgi:hypothetical protein
VKLDEGDVDGTIVEGFPCPSAGTPESHRLVRTNGIDDHDIDDRSGFETNELDGIESFGARTKEEAPEFD